MADLVRRELADALERGLVQQRRPLVAVDVRRGQALEDHVVLAIAQRPERHRRLDDLAGARIGDRAAGAPAARRSVDPVDHVVADVHRVGALGQDVHLERVAEARGLERLIPPAGAFEQRLLHVLRRARVHPVLNRLDRLAHRRRRIFLLQAMTTDVAELHRLADRHAVVHEGQAAVAGARIVDARRVVAVGQLHQRHVLAHRHGVGRRRDAADRAREQVAAEPAAATTTASAAPIGAGPCVGPPPPPPPAGSLVDEGQRHVDLGVLREVPACWAGRTRCACDRRGSCPAAARPAALVTSRSRKSVASTSTLPPDSPATVKPHRIDLANESSTDFRFERVLAARSERLVGLDQHHARADALEAHEAAAAALPAIETDVVRSQTGGEAGREQEVAVESRDLEKHRSRSLVPVEREVAVDFPHPVGAVFDRRDRGRTLLALLSLRRRLCARGHAGRTGQQEDSQEIPSVLEHRQTSRREFYATCHCRLTERPIDRLLGDSAMVD